MMPARTWKLLDEEKFLTQNLPGYTEYKQKVIWRLMPFVCNNRETIPRSLLGARLRRHAT